MYQVVHEDGQVSDPMDLNALQALAEERRLNPQQMVIDAVSGRTLPAAEMLSDQIVFPETQAMVATPFSAPFSNPVVAPLPYSVPPPAMALPEPDSTLLGLRFGGYLVDFLCALPLLLLAFIPFAGLLFAPLLGLYWVSRDAFFGGQSIGKKAVGLKVVRLDGKPVDWGTSVKRNIVFAPLLLAAIPFAGVVLGSGLLGLINIVEVVMVLTTQRRIGDNIAQTVVVRA